MQRRKFLIGMGSMAAGGAAAVGTGAVDTISTDRDLAVDVAGDASAYLGLDPGDSQFVKVDDNENVIGLDFASDANGGSGVNNEGSTEARPAFTLENNSDEELYALVSNPLMNNDITSSTTNNTGYAGDITVPAGLDVQFAASTTVPQFANDEVGLIDRASAPQSSDNFGAPSDPRTIARDSGQYANYNFIEVDDTGYIRIPSGESVPITVRAVTDGFDVQNDSVPGNARFVVNATSSGSELPIDTAEDITSAINLDGARYS